MQPKAQSNPLIIYFLIFLSSQGLIGVLLLLTIYLDGNSFTCFFVLDYLLFIAKYIHTSILTGTRLLRNILPFVTNFVSLHLNMIEIKNIQGEVIAKVDAEKLYFADLSNLDLRGADFKGECLAWTYFSGANLEGADLRGANLCQAGIDLYQLEKAITDQYTVFPEEREFCHI